MLSNDGAQNSNNTYCEEIGPSTVSKKARIDEAPECSATVVTGSHSLTTSNVAVVDEASFNYFNDIAKHANLANEIL